MTTFPERANNATRHIVVVEDEAITRTKLAGYFETEGYRVSEAESGPELWRAIDEGPVDLVLLDINLPGEDGLSIARRLRERHDLGIILVTCRSDEIDRIVGLEIGADDYVTKPFNHRELLARVRSVLRRAAPGRSLVERDDEVFRFEGWQFDTRRRELRSPEGEAVPLTRAEFELLGALVRHPCEVMSRERLLTRITHRRWDGSDRTVDVLVRRLRRKIEPDPQDPKLIKTVHGEGYVFACETE